MTNYFLKVNKDLFKLKLNPLELLIVSQILEFQANTNDCFISNKVLAEQFGVSEKTVARALDSLEQRQLITRNTRNVKGGKERHMRVDVAKIEELTKDKLTLDNANNGQNVPCTKDNLTLVKGQNDSIKDNIKDNNLKEKKEKDNMELAAAPLIPESLTAKAVKDSHKYPTVSVAWLVSNNIKYEPIEGTSNLVVIGATKKVVKVV